MPTKRKRPTTKKKSIKVPTFLDRLPKNHAEYLQRLIQLSQNQVDGHSESLDQLFTEQVQKLRGELNQHLSDQRKK